MNEYQISVKRRLNELKSKFPILEGLINLLGDGYKISRTFSHHYHQSDINYSQKAMILRVLLADTSVYKSNETIIMNDDWLNNVILYFKHHPKSIAKHPDAARKDDIPKALSSITGIPRSSGIQFFNHFVNIPYAQWINNQPVELFDSAGISACAKILEPLYRTRILTTKHAKEIIDGISVCKNYAIYFNTAVPALNISNALNWYEAYIHTDRLGGRVQNKMPTLISSMLGIPRLSLPSLDAALDLLILSRLDCLSYSDLHSELELIAPCIEAPLVTKHRNNWLLDPGKCKNIHEHISSTGTYGTSMYFNIERLIDRNPLFKRYVDCYSSVKTNSLLKIILEHYHSLDSTFANRLQQYINRLPGYFTSIGARDMANCLYYCHYLENIGEEPRDKLPSVAKFKLGMKEYTTAKSSNPVSRRSSPAQRSPSVLPVYDECLSSAHPLRDYLLYHTYNGTLPDDGNIYIPSSIARAYESLPEGIQCIGRDTVPFGLDPYHDAQTLLNEPVLLK